MISQLELDTAPKVTLAGNEYPIPMLVPRQQRIVVPALMLLMKTMSVNGKVDPTSLTTEQYDMLLDLVYVALTRGSPLLKRDDFLDMPTNMMELIVAMNVVAEQSGVMKRETTATGEVATGEAPAGSLIGTASLPV
jgi:hypothetical protein